MALGFVNRKNANQYSLFIDKYLLGLKLRICLVIGTCLYLRLVASNSAFAKCFLLIYWGLLLHRRRG